MIEIDETQVKSFKTSQLPGNWRDVPAPYSTKVFGTKWLDKGIGVLKITSTVIPDEFNYIINPAIGDEHFKLISVKDFIYYLRVKNV